MIQATGTNPIYGPRFWATYAANIGLMIAVSLLFRYANFVAVLGGTEEQLGWITGLGMLGGISARCFLGVAIDTYGAGRVWVLSLVLLVCCLIGHLTITTLQPPWIYLLRILYTISLAGAFGASITFITFRAPPERMGEMIGMLGSSGFLGMGVGPIIGDWLFVDTTPEALPAKLFGCAAGAALVSLLFSSLATWGQGQPTHEATHDHENTQESLRLLPLIQSYHPGWTLIVGCAMGVGIGTPGTFLSAFAEVKSIENLGWFWVPYSAVAFIVRIATRKLADEWGTRPTILLGLFCLAASMFAYLVVRTPVSLILPASLGGISHAFLFPAVVAEGNRSFPAKYRGVATTLMLMMFDMGLLFGQPTFGWTVETVRKAGRDGYAFAFGALGIGFLVVAATYWRSGRRASPVHDGA